MSAEQKWNLDDTFNNWLDKHNSVVDTVDSLTADVDFKYVPTETVGRIVKIGGGKLRDGGDVFVVAGTTLTLPASVDVVIGVVKDSETSHIRYYVSGDQPAYYFVPLFSFKTNNFNVISYSDLRTQISYDRAGQGDATQPSMLFFDRNITENVIIPAGKAALSVAPIIADGVVVTVAEGAEWVIV